MLNKIISAIALWGIKGYQKVLSPMISAVFGSSVRCRFYPSCSVYARQSLESHGAWKGILLAMGRILRCHPFHSGGIDTVPKEFSIKGIWRGSGDK